MNIQYFRDTDTLYIEFKGCDIVETHDLDENTVLDLDKEGRVCALTLEHASLRADLPHVVLEGLTAPPKAKAPNQ
jgi:uncharacterized protein YuzE